MRIRSQLARVLVLTTLFAILAAASGLAITSPTPLSAANPSQAAPPVAAAAFLAALSADFSSASAAVFAVDCRVTFPNCPGDKLCCRACGTPDCNVYACFEPVDGHCPAIP